MNFNCSGCRGETMDHACGREPKSRLLPQSFYDDLVLSLQTEPSKEDLEWAQGVVADKNERQIPENASRHCPLG